MNEQLIVKNFGPITDATVDFKRVTVFIGPTGGGKSTLAKLAAIMKQGNALDFDKPGVDELLGDFGLEHYLQEDKTDIHWQIESGLGFGVSATLKDNSADKSLELNQVLIDDYEENHAQYKEEIASELDKLLAEPQGSKLPVSLITELREGVDSIVKRYIKDKFKSVLFPLAPQYIPAERIFLAAIGESWAGIIRDDIGLPKLFVEFANKFAVARKTISELTVPFLSVKFNHREGQDYINISEEQTYFRLSETASGIQSVTPLLVLLEHLSRNTEQAQSFIIEEPELNLYPTAQQGLLNWLVEKCTKGENDLTITTHSPYILSHLNLMLYAYQVAQKHPDRKADIAAIVPEASWINPKEFACYQVEGGGVHSLVDAELGLIDNNALDNISGDKADAFDQLININRGFAHA